MTTIESMSCCGVGELEDLCNSPKKTLIEVAGHWFDDEEDWSFYNFQDSDFNGTFLVFSDTRKRGHDLAKYITKNKLGELVTPRAKKNPNSSNMLKVWLWRVNIGAFKKWYKLNKS